MIAAHELAVFSLEFCGVLVLVGAIVAAACHGHRDLARERHRERKDGGLFR